MGPGSTRARALGRVGKSTRKRGVCCPLPAACVPEISRELWPAASRRTYMKAGACAKGANTRTGPKTLAVLLTNTVSTWLVLVFYMCAPADPRTSRCPVSSSNAQPTPHCALQPASHENNEYRVQDTDTDTDICPTWHVPADLYTVHTLLHPIECFLGSCDAKPLSYRTLSWDGGGATTSSADSTELNLAPPSG